MHDLAKGLTGAAKITALNTMAGTPIPTFNCPSRRSSIAYPQHQNEKLQNAGVPPSLAHSDYGGNGGVFSAVGSWGNSSQTEDEINFPNLDRGGLTYLRSEVGFRRISDGTSSTMYIGEKYLDPLKYRDSSDGADNNSMFAGHDWDIIRWVGGAPRVGSEPWNVYVFDHVVSIPPRQDRAGFSSINLFGSSHPAGANYVFCDGSVHGINYNIDDQTWIRLGIRDDGLPLDNEQL